MYESLCLTVRIYVLIVRGRATPFCLIEWALAVIVLVNKIRAGSARVQIRLQNDNSPGEMFWSLLWYSQFVCTTTACCRPGVDIDWLLVLQCLFICFLYTSLLPTLHCFSRMTRHASSVCVQYMWTVETKLPFGYKKKKFSPSVSVYETTSVCEWAGWLIMPTSRLLRMVAGRWIRWHHSSPC